jgi:A/G-specific adenine glycosylase
MSTVIQQGDDRESTLANERLFAWYRPRRRAFPWRARHRDPYPILVSEVMLQQTQASRVAAAFEPFIERFPTVANLAAAPRSAVVTTWGGLGYPRKAVALSRAARTIVDEHGGEVPRDLESLRGLPGIGPYTASAVASLAYGTRVPAIDTNVARVVARVRLGAEAHDSSRADIAAAAEAWIDASRPGDWNQAAMDLGREICRPRPRCHACPLAARCTFARLGRLPSRPQRRPSTFEGSDRQVRGSVVRLLRSTPSRSMSLSTLAARSGHSEARVAACVVTLVADGIIAAGSKALRGDSSGRVRLHDGNAPDQT